MTAKTITATAAILLLLSILGLLFQFSQNPGTIVDQLAELTTQTQPTPTEAAQQTASATDSAKMTDTPDSFPTKTPVPTREPQPTATPSEENDIQSSNDVTSRSCYKVTINGEVYEECSENGDLEFHYSD